VLFAYNHTFFPPKVFGPHQIFGLATPLRPLHMFKIVFRDSALYPKQLP